MSIVTPCFNEEDSVLNCYLTIKALFDTVLHQYDYEHIFCDNASTDGTVLRLKSIAENDKNVKLIINSRNFGILNNTYNGVINASGDAVVLFMPVDMQDPPELLPQFIEHWENGYEIIYGVRAEREEGKILASLRKLYYKLLKKITYVEYPCNVGDYQLIDKCVLNAMKQMEDNRPFMRLMTFYCGFKSIGIPYTWKARQIGKSKNKFSHMLGQGLNGLTSFSNAPLRFALVTGVLIAGISGIYFAISLILFLFGITASLTVIPVSMVGQIFFFGTQLFFMGFLGEYIFAIYDQVRRRPIVIERERINFPSTT